MDPPWFNNQIKILIEKKNYLFKSCMNNDGLVVDRARLQKAGVELISILINFYNNLAKKLNDPSTSNKTYWSIMKTFINGKKPRIIPPLLVNKNLISNFREKTNNVLNDFFVQQCQLLANNSILPKNQISYTQNRPRDFDIDCEKIFRLINGLNSNKAYDHDRITIRIVKLCNLTITKSQSIMYKSCLQQGVFPDDREKGNIISVHK